MCLFAESQDIYTKRVFVCANVCVLYERNTQVVAYLRFFSSRLVCDDRSDPYAEIVAESSFVIKEKKKTERNELRICIKQINKRFA